MEQSKASTRVGKWLKGRWRKSSLLAAMFGFSAAESTVVPIPLELVLIPVMQRNRPLVWALATAVTAGALAGSLIFYGLAALAFDTVGRELIATMGWQAQQGAFESFFDRWGFWAIVAAGILPIPLQLGMIAAGAAHYPIWLFCIAILVSRTTRYFGIGWLVLRFGERAEDLFRRHKGRFMAIALLVLAVFWGLTFLLQRIAI